MTLDDIQIFITGMLTCCVLISLVLWIQDDPSLYSRKGICIEAHAKQYELETCKGVIE